tara:strand:+ start:1429 stop:1728 length:300 start_codon:yes stop_codon:yes gene_type:complete
MKFTIIKDDQAVYEDGDAIEGVDLSDLPEDLHALHWDGNSGEIEWKTVTTPNQEISSEDEIESALGVSFTALRERRTARIAEIQAELDAQAEALQAENG